MSSPSAENLRRCIEGNSSAIWFGVVHLGSRNMEFEGCPAAGCTSSLVSAENISLAVAAASADHRKGIKGTMAHRRCNRHGRMVGLPERIVNAVDHRSLPALRRIRPLTLMRRKVQDIAAYTDARWSDQFVRERPQVQTTASARGSWLALLEFPSAEAVKAFATDPKYAPYAAARQAGSESPFQLIDDTDLAGTIPYLPKG
jgi:uncharacterized protein (DUF1330 family)